MNTDSGTIFEKLNFNLSGYDRKYSDNHFEIEEAYQKADTEFSEKWKKTDTQTAAVSAVDDNGSGDEQQQTFRRTDKAVEQIRTQILYERIYTAVAEFQRTHAEENIGKELIAVLESSLKESEKKSVSYNDVFETVSRIETILNEQTVKETFQNSEEPPYVQQKNTVKDIVTENTEDTESTSENSVPQSDEVLTVQEKIVLVNHTRNRRKYTYDEKINALKKIQESHLTEDKNFNRYLRNKIALLTKVRDSGFVLQPLPKKKSTPTNAQGVQQTPDLKTQRKQETIAQLTKTIATYRTKHQKFMEILRSNLISSDEKVNLIMEIELAEKDTRSRTPSVRTAELPQENIVQMLEKRKTITKNTVNSQEYFKFGAGKQLKFDIFSLTVPSTYTFSEDFFNDRYVICHMDTAQGLSAENLINSPLIVEISKNKKHLCDSFFEFFNSNINYCNRNNIRYRQSTVSGFPCVFKHKENDSRYVVSLYNTCGHYIIEIGFTFSVKCTNAESIVSRMLNGLHIERIS